MTHTVSSSLTDRTLNRIMAIESRGKPRAKAPSSSALGLFQFINDTWIGTTKKHRPDLFKGRTQAQVLALRTSPSVCIELGARFTEDNAEGLGSGYTDGDLYLAHFLGLGGARKLFRAKPDASAAALAGPKAVKANPTILSGKTVAQVRAWAQRSMETRWKQDGETDYIAKYYNHDDPLLDINHRVPAEPEPEETVDEELPDEHDDTRAPVEPAEDDEPGFFTRAKSAIKSKIAWVLGGLGGTGASTSVANDGDMMDLLGRLLHKPAFYIAIACIIAAGVGIYFYWRDHGKGRLR